MYGISVEEIKKDVENIYYNVVVARGDNDHEYNVVLPHEYYNQVSKNECTEEEFIKKAFNFLIDHENPSSILPSFAIPKIEEYFPEFTLKVMDY
jgi:hypothetical protein